MRHSAWPTGSERGPDGIRTRRGVPSRAGAALLVVLLVIAVGACAQARDRDAAGTDPPASWPRPVGHPRPRHRGFEVEGGERFSVELLDATLVANAAGAAGRRGRAQHPGRDRRPRRSGPECPVELAPGPGHRHLRRPDHRGLRRRPVGRGGRGMTDRCPLLPVVRDRRRGRRSSPDRRARPPATLARCEPVTLGSGSASGPPGPTTRSPMCPA